MKEFEEILSYHTGYSVEELKERQSEPLLQPYDVLLAKKEWEQQVKLFAIPDVVFSEAEVCKCGSKNMFVDEGKLYCSDCRKLADVHLQT
ncbi:MAG: hypothetical protein VKL39_20640 [Leptolyngbyaceae bacterium]|nr:hypothetical protein [Leptolyngbyaceae bacterium]